MTSRLPILGALLIALAALMYPDELQSQSEDSLKPPDRIPPVSQEQGYPQLQSPDEALAHDLALIATARGWTVEQAEADFRAAAAVGRIAEQVAANRPDIFVGSVVSPEPGGPPALYIKGPADDFVRGLVAQAEIGVQIVDEQPYSFEELKERSMELHESLQGQGFTNLSTGFDITAPGVIQAAVTRRPGLPNAANEILSRLPLSVRDSVTLKVEDVPVAVEEHVMGGMQMRYDAVDRCTSGWSVYNEPWAVTGITTAGHCEVNRIVEPGVGVWSLTLTGEHRGLWGDVEWHQSPRIEAARFYATSTIVRDVTALEGWTNISQGETVCFYGRASNSRTCRAVENVFYSCSPGDVTYNHLIRMNDNVGTAGDSGGGWSLSNTAYGSHVGQCSGKDVFTIADVFDDALAIRVRLSHTLPTRMVLETGDQLVSADGRFVAVMQNDGNFVLYQTGSTAALWATSWCGQTAFGPGILAVMQSDGNFVLYPAGSTSAVWATSFPQTQPNCPSNQQTVFGAGIYMTMQNDGNLVMYGPGGAVWHTNTCCR